MRIVHIAAEFSPIAKAGGLGEVVLGLGRELTQTGLDVEIIIPKYDLIDTSKLSHLRTEVPDFKCLNSPNAMWSAKCEECRIHLLEARHPAGFFHRGKIYGCEDDIARFTYFSRAALEYLLLQKKPIDILHLHDWHVALCAPMVREIFKELKVKAIVLSIHNGEYQGKCATFDLDRVGLKGESYLTPDKLQDDDARYPQTINLLKGGINYADAVIPVSPSYAKEILTATYGFNLDRTFKKNQAKITGILNGLDAKLWDPATDKRLSYQYGVESAASGKEKNRRQFPLNAEARPWVGAVTRLVPQKGPELFEEALKKTLEAGGTFCLLGAPADSLKQHFEELKEKYKGNKQVLLHYQYDETLAHLLYSALDFVLVPSHFEPCGLTQLIAMRYGAVPIVRSVGGLKDTVFDFEDATVAANKRNGFTFAQATKVSMNAALLRAFKLFRTDSGSFKSLMRRGMEADYSWKKPAHEYLRVYRKLIEKNALGSSFTFSIDWLRTKLQDPI